MIFGKHINRYYLKYAGWLVLGLVALVMVDFLQLEIPNLYGMVIDGMSKGYVNQNGVAVPFDFGYFALLCKLCLYRYVYRTFLLFGVLWRNARLALPDDGLDRRIDPAKPRSFEYPYGYDL